MRTGQPRRCRRTQSGSLWRTLWTNSPEDRLLPQCRHLPIPTNLILLEETCRSPNCFSPEFHRLLYLPSLAKVPLPSPRNLGLIGSRLARTSLRLPRTSCLSQTRHMWPLPARRTVHQDLAGTTNLMAEPSQPRLEREKPKPVLCGYIRVSLYDLRANSCSWTVRKARSSFLTSLYLWMMFKLLATLSSLQPSL
jgi:hypothetical protein